MINFLGFLSLVVIIILVILFLIYFINIPTNDYEKHSAYECGFEPFGDARSFFDIHFYTVGLLFIIFDLEIVFLIPFAVNIEATLINEYINFIIFMIILLVGFYYEWSLGLLNLLPKKLFKNINVNYNFLILLNIVNTVPDNSDNNNSWIWWIVGSLITVATVTLLYIYWNPITGVIIYVFSNGTTSSSSVTPVVKSSTKVVKKSSKVIMKQNQELNLVSHSDEQLNRWGENVNKYQYDLSKLKPNDSVNNALTRTQSDPRVHGEGITVDNVIPWTLWKDGIRPYNDGKEGGSTTIIADYSNNRNNIGDGNGPILPSLFDTFDSSLAVMLDMRCLFSISILLISILITLISYYINLISIKAALYPYKIIYKLLGT